MAGIQLVPPNLDGKKLTIAAVIVVIFLVVVLSLQFIIPLLSIFAAIGIIGFAIYGVLKYLRGN